VATASPGLSVREKGAIQKSGLVVMARSRNGE